MTTYKEGKHPASFILTEEEGTMSRDNVEIAVGQKFPPGTIVKAGVPYTGGGGGDLAIAIYGVDTTAADAVPVKVACISRMAEVNRHELSYPDGWTDTQIDAAAVELAKQMIVVRGAPLPSPVEAMAAREGGEGPFSGLRARQPSPSDRKPG